MEDILQIKSKDEIRYKGKRLNGEQITQLREDANRFNESIIWKMLGDDAKYQANFRMYNSSKDFESMMFGKAILFAIDIMEEKMRQLKNL